MSSEEKEVNESIADQAPACACGDQDESKTKPSTDSGTGQESLLDKTTSSKSTTEWFREQFTQMVKISDEPKLESLLDEVSFEGIARYIKSDKCKKIVTMAGAGISTSAGIPDFRSPGTGLYHNLEKYNLPNPHAVFDISYFDENPEPFFTLCKELFPAGEYKPTPCHYFVKLLEKKKKLLRHFTQNIDSLERAAGLSDNKLIEAHGTFNTGHCRNCKKEYNMDWFKEKMKGSETNSAVPYCDKVGCNGVVKPDVVFFGEELPAKFSQHISDLQKCDMLVIMGTSLVVQPFASLAARVKKNVPRLYINLENTTSDIGLSLFYGEGFNFDKKNNIRDVFWKGDCDNGCYTLADLLGWGQELQALVKNENAQLEKKSGKKRTSGGKGHKPPKL